MRLQNQHRIKRAKLFNRHLYTINVGIKSTTHTVTFIQKLFEMVFIDLLRCPFFYFPKLNNT